MNRPAIQPICVRYRVAPGFAHGWRGGLVVVVGGVVGDAAGTLPSLRANP